MSWLGGLIGRGVVGPVVEAVSDVSQSREVTKQVIARAKAAAEIAAATWRPWLARATFWCLIAYVAGTSWMVTTQFAGIAYGAEWATLTPNGPLDLLWDRWIALGEELFTFATVFITGYAVARSAFDKGDAGHKLGALFGRGQSDRDADEPAVVRESMREPDSRIGRRLDGVSVPSRQSFSRLPTADDPPPHPDAATGRAPWQWSRASRGELQLTRPDLRRLALDALPWMPYDIGILQSLRTAEESAENRARGVSWTTTSRHEDHDHDGTADAIDFGVYLGGQYVNGDIEPEKRLYRACAEVWRQRAAVLSIPIRLGADWGVEDLGHVEVLRVTSRPDVDLPA